MSKTQEDQLLHRLAAIAEERDRSTESESDDPRVEAAGRPLDAQAKARIVESLKQVVPEHGFDAPAPAEKESTEEKAPLPFPDARTRRSPTWRFALPLAAALVVVLAAIVYRSAVAPIPGSADALPTYAVRVAGTVEAERGGPELPEATVEHGGRIETAPGNRLEIVLTPSRAVADAPTARAFLEDGDGWRPVAEGFVAVSPQGAVRLDAIVGTELAVPDTGARLLLVVGDPDRLPSPAEAARAAGSGDESSIGRDSTDRDEAPWRAFLFDLALVSP